MLGKEKSVLAVKTTTLLGAGGGGGGAMGLDEKMVNMSIGKKGVSTLLPFCRLLLREV